MYIPLEIPFPRIDPAAFTIPLPEMALGPINLGPFPVRWYALGYIFGLLLGWWYAARIVSTPRLWGEGPAGPIKKQDIDDFAFYAMIGILLGGRIGYILFYTIPYEAHKLSGDPMFILRMWEGGMSFHGGLIGAIIAVFATSWLRKIPVISLGDVACAAAPIGICLVRIANFINGELFGRPTDAPWAMRFPDYNWATREWGSVDGKPLVHPSQLYEAALEGLLLFVVCGLAVWKFRMLRKPGMVAGIFLIGYALSRTFVENFREPDNFTQGVMPAWFTMGMLLSIPMILGGAYLIWRANRAPGQAKAA
ncbi:MAG: prolipoprotein diacylglyceryl transferase [Sphingomonadales bacterium]|nr:MAG: prolipoprotein diacylglyceryl transferase [Sphingomonadales bacterium]